MEEEDERGWYHRHEVRAIWNDPTKAETRPRPETAPFIPGGHVLKGFVSSLGFDLDSIPSSEERVSEVVAA